jgi:molybdopterin synthase catalytic subunit
MHEDCFQVVDVSDARLDPSVALTQVLDPRYGGINLFVGRVRNRNRGRDVVAITYEVFEPLVFDVFRQIREKLVEQVGPEFRVYIAHAKGRLAVGGIAVVVAVGTVHRDEAFRACRSAIEQLKHSAPIWKQEHYAEGDSEWSEGCSLCDEHPHDPAGIRR